MTSATANPEWVDRFLIREQIEAYIHYADVREPEKTVAIFARDGEFSSNMAGFKPIKGHAAIKEFLMGSKALGREMNHGVSTVVVDVDGDTARSTALCVSHIAVGEEVGGSILVRGIRYDDEWIREDGRWVIAKRHHQGMFQGSAVSLPPRLPIEK